MIDVEERVEVINGKRERSRANLHKIEAVKHILDVISEDDVNYFFLTIAHAAEARGYNLQAEPELILAQLDQKFKDA